MVLSYLILYADLPIAGGFLIASILANAGGHPMAGRFYFWMLLTLIPGIIMFLAALWITIKMNQIEREIG